MLTLSRFNPRERRQRSRRNNRPSGAEVVLFQPARQTAIATSEVIAVLPLDQPVSTRATADSESRLERVHDLLAFQSARPQTAIATSDSDAQASLGFNPRNRRDRDLPHCAPGCYPAWRFNPSDRSQ
jgi:hypothetical protein